MDIALSMMSGIDLCLNTPLPPREAFGTSGMKAAFNGMRYRIFRKSAPDRCIRAGKTMPTLALCKTKKTRHRTRFLNVQPW